MNTGTRIFDQALSPELTEARAALANVQSQFDKRAKRVVTFAQSVKAGALARDLKER